LVWEWNLVDNDEVVVVDDEPLDEYEKPIQKE